MNYHIYNFNFINVVGLPSKAKVGDVFTLSEPSKGSERQGCRGIDVVIPPGTYKIVSRKGFKAGTQEITAC
jgi:hypothetical protein